MTERRVQDWLLRLGLGRYATVFSEQGIDWDVLPDLTDADLERLGVVLGHRKKMLKDIASLDGDVPFRPPSLPFATAAEAMGAEPPAPAAGADPPPRFLPDGSAERRHLTVMFCDMVGSTPLSRLLDPEDMLAVIRSYQKVCTSVVRAYQGSVAQYMGDGILAYFGYPVASERDAERAVRTALGIIEAIGPFGERVKLQKGETVAVRIGIATGIVVLGDLDGTRATHARTAIGPTPNLAARIQAFAQVNTAVVAESTYRLLRNRFEFDDLGAHTLAGFAEPERLWRVVRPASSGRRGTRRSTLGLVGRRRELTVLRQMWRDGLAGRGRAVVIEGEPGIGKTHLAAAFESSVAEPHACLSFACSPFHQNTALSPVIEQLARLARLEDTDDDAARLAKLEGALVGPPATKEAALPLMAALLSISTSGRCPPVDVSPAKQRSLTLAALIEQCALLAADRPALIHVEDVQWIDATSLELIDRLVERLPSLRILVLMTARPTAADPFAQRPQVRCLRLARMSAAETIQIIEGVLAGKHLPQAIFEHIVQRTDGVPLFIEELTKTVVESGLTAPAAHSGKPSAAELPRAIPATIHDSLMARLDQLAAAKDVAQVGSVIGRQFSFALLAAVTALPQTLLAGALARLVASELVQEKGGSHGASYVFKHALVQDAAYDSLLLSNRRKLHLRVATVLENQFPETVRLHPEEVAHHFTEGGDAIQAADHWRRAAEIAGRRSALHEAVEHLTRGLNALRSCAETEERARAEVTLLLPLGAASIALKGARAPEVEALYGRALSLCEHLPETALSFAALWGWWRISMHFETGRERADRLLALAARLGDRDLLLQAHHCLWATLFNLGDQDTCMQHIEQGLALYEPERHAADAVIYGGHDAKACALGEGALCLWLRGRDRAAQAFIEDAERWAGELGQASSLAHAMDFATMLSRYRRDARAVFRQGNALIQFAEAKGFTDHAAKGRLFRGWARVMIGEADQGLEELNEAVRQQRAMATEEDFSVYFDMLAEAYQAVGATERALAQVREGLKVANRTGIHYWTAELERRRGELLADAGAPAEEIARCFTTARVTAEAQGARALALRAATSYARWLRSRAEDDAARTVLAPLVDGFRDEPATAEVSEAKELVASLAPEMSAGAPK
jgi:class 3 adenylate cyclase/predicted ATPase